MHPRDSPPREKGERPWGNYCFSLNSFYSYSLGGGAKNRVVLGN